MKVIEHYTEPHIYSNGYRLDMNKIERMEAIKSLKEQIVYMYSINCAKLAEILKADLAAIEDEKE